MVRSMTDRTAPGETRQLALPIDAAPSYTAVDFIDDASNAQARGFLARPDAWPEGRLALHGPADAGKTHLARIIAAARGWAWVRGDALRGLPPPPLSGTVMDDADLVPEPAALFHAINAAREAGLPLLLIGRAAPSRWHAGPADLVSRLRATTATEIGAPTDALLMALLVKHLADRQLAVAPALQALLLAHLPRSASAIARAAALLDAAALATGRLNRATVLAVLRDNFEE